MSCWSSHKLPRSFIVYDISFTVSAEPRVLVSDIIKRCAAEHDISESALVSRSRKRRIARPRQKVMWLSKRLTNASLSEIARKLNRTDHTTVLHGIKTVERLITEDDDQVEGLISLLMSFANVRCTNTVSAEGASCAIPMDDAFAVDVEDELKMQSIFNEAHLKGEIHA